MATKITYRTLGNPSAEQTMLEQRQAARVGELTIDQRTIILSGELKAAYERIRRLEADLVECLEFLRKNYDVRDGDNGEQLPNEEMRLGTMIQMTLHGPGNF